MSSVQSLIIVDPGVEDHESFVRNLPEGSNYVVLKENQDGLEQIVDILSENEFQRLYVSIQSATLLI